LLVRQTAIAHLNRAQGKTGPQPAKASRTLGLKATVDIQATSTPSQRRNRVFQSHRTDVKSQGGIPKHANGRMDQVLASPLWTSMLARPRPLSIIQRGACGFEGPATAGPGGSATLLPSSSVVLMRLWSCLICLLPSFGRRGCHRCLVVEGRKSWMGLAMIANFR